MSFNDMIAENKSKKKRKTIIDVFQDGQKTALLIGVVLNLVLLSIYVFVKLYFK